jgi:hypothetical protein
VFRVFVDLDTGRSPRLVENRPINQLTVQSKLRRGTRLDSPCWRIERFTNYLHRAEASSPLITRPSTTSHSGMSATERARAGIGDGLIRLSIGLESSDDLIEGFETTLAG